MEEQDAARKHIQDMNRYLQEPFSTEEEELISDWLAKQPKPPEALNLQKIKEEIYHGISLETGAEAKGASWRTGMRIAASLVLCLIIGVSAYRLQKGGRRDDITISNDSGQAGRAVLPDSSVVWLNADSRIRIPAGFKDGERIVYLEEGEVFFHVRRNEKQPFLVHTPQLTVKVLGTSFGIKSYERLAEVRVTVASGLVSIGKREKELRRLGKDRELVFDKARQDYSVREVESGKLLSWRRGEIFLEDAPLAELVLALEKKYRVDISCPAELMESERINIRVGPGQPLKEVLDVIMKIYDVGYEIKGKEVVIRK